ncbi:hypothetical protein FGO68_gene11135 [Halteria grandinella]|uniref:TLDc domain-containing protein n=1 Tax=Halteria grandinella TaxID=5974 RepID=A0A8J8NQZ5_HALGN|nr:hypothetical protein FGO68_gene11135 [Halteria grandinella]
MLKQLAAHEIKHIQPQEEVKQDEKIPIHARIDLKKIIDSIIIDDECKFCKIMTFLSQACLRMKQLSLLYRGSVHSFKAKAFHQQCNDFKSTLTIVKTKEGKIMGGFTKQTWKGENDWKYDQAAWLFNIEAPNIFKARKKNMFALFACQRFGPIFGEGHALCIYDDCNTRNDNYVNSGKSFDCGEYGNILLTKRKETFIVQEIEVFQV